MDAGPWLVLPREAIGTGVGLTYYVGEDFVALVEGLLKLLGVGEAVHVAGGAVRRGRS